MPLPKIGRICRQWHLEQTSEPFPNGHEIRSAEAEKVCHCDLAVRGLGREVKHRRKERKNLIFHVDRHNIDSSAGVGNKGAFGSREGLADDSLERCSIEARKLGVCFTR